MTPFSISTQALRRLPKYLRYLKSTISDTAVNISATTIASDLNLNHVQVRKDLAAISSEGRPKQGYNRITLISDIESFLGFYYKEKTVLVGTGKLGTALMAYKGFSEYGLDIVAAFDTDKNIIGHKLYGKDIYSITNLKEYCKQNKIMLAIITTPSNAAQEICDELISGGVIAIWNFTNVHLKVPDNVIVVNEDMLASFTVLINHIYKQEGR